MAGTWRSARRRILTPNVSATRLDVRGFHAKSDAATQLLESIGRTFLEGFAAVAQARGPVQAHPELEAVPPPLRGFAYEGAAMACAILDALPTPGRDRVPALLTGPGAGHVYMTYVGVGWAMARLPRVLWSRLWAPDPLLRWLILDGYGFHEAYFHTERVVHRQRPPGDVDWPPEGYPSRVIDQGIGRALWFVEGADPDRITATIRSFAPHRHGDLYSGAGLAATYAGGADEDELRRFHRDAGEHRSAVAQGSAFGAQARVRAGNVVAHTAVATEVFCGVTPEKAAAVTNAELPDGDHADGPSYERWRQGIAAAFAGRSA
ncbi:DUF1702 family protein [Luedemannella helvata]|uniref:DUF1702 family protein n=1 Tax=Luedemannella helvata TaxID=349315 RepID=A0ABN2KVF3_9ACTN